MMTQLNYINCNSAVESQNHASTLAMVGLVVRGTQHPLNTQQFDNTEALVQRALLQHT